MTMPYPIVKHHELHPVPKREWFNGKLFSPKPTRSTDEIPRSKPDHRLVYRVGGNFVLDNFALALDSGTVLEATDVTVVDVSRDMAVSVTFTIPSQDASAFTVHARFLCSVTDPVAVVKHGPSDLTIALETYLLGHYQFEAIGRSHNLDEFNEVRVQINARAEAFTTFEPPAFPGLHLRFASAQVLTPAVAEDYYGKLRALTNSANLEAARDRSKHELQLDRTGFEHAEAIRAQSNRNVRENEQLQHDLQRFQDMQAAVPNALEDIMRYGVLTGQLTFTESIGVLRQLRHEADDYARVRGTREWDAARTDRLAERQTMGAVLERLIKEGYLSAGALPYVEEALQRFLNGSSVPAVEDASTQPRLSVEPAQVPDDGEIVNVRPEVREEDDD